ncbi:MAG: hypothetical protein JO273_09205 [Methylobacteriaceae bacterium]|nr:hypothetical protein [Methylobacteriaceae bacterium]
MTPDAGQIVAALGERLLAAGAASVVLPSLSWPRASHVEAALTPLAERMRKAAEEAARLDDAAAQAKASVAKLEPESNPPTALAPAKPDAADEKAAELYGQAAAKLREALAKADAYVASLSAADDKGVTALAKIMREKVGYGVLTREGALALYLDVRATVGGTFSKASLWTFFRNTAPFYAMGGVVVSYTLNDADGKLLASDLVPVQRGYERVQELASRL